MWKVSGVNQLTCRNFSSAFKGLRVPFIGAHAKCDTQAGALARALAWALALACSANLLARLAGVKSRQLPLLMAHECSEGWEGGCCCWQHFIIMPSSKHVNKHASALHTWLSL